MVLCEGLKFSSVMKFKDFICRIHGKKFIFFVNLATQLNYCLQRSWGKVIFSEACVKNYVHGGGGWYPSMPWAVCLSACWDTPGTGTPPQGAGTPLPPEQCMLGDTANKRVVSIILECILVWK